MNPVDPFLPRQSEQYCMFQGLGDPCLTGLETRTHLSPRWAPSVL